jgi:hypothetical protein
VTATLQREVSRTLTPGSPATAIDFCINNVLSSGVGGIAYATCRKPRGTATAA